MRTPSVLVPLMLAALGVAVSAQTSPPAPGTYNPDVPVTREADTSALARIKSDPRLSTFASWVVASGQESLLRTEKLTVFAPTNDACSKLPASLLEELLEPHGKAKATRLVRNHVGMTILNSDELAAAKDTRNFANRRITISRQGNRLMVGEAKVTQADITASNGVIHVIDRVLEIPAADALEAIMAQGNCTMFARMVQLTGLDARLKSESPITVVAPTDEAWARLDKSFVDGLLDPDKRDELEKVVRRHLFPGTIPTRFWSAGGQFPSLAGDRAQAAFQDGRLVFNRTAFLVKGDIEAANGTLHLVSDVLRWVPTGENAPKELPPPPPEFAKPPPGN